MFWQKSTWWPLGIRFSIPPTKGTILCDVYKYRTPTKGKILCYVHKSITPTKGPILCDDYKSRKPPRGTIFCDVYKRITNNPPKNVKLEELPWIQSMYLLQHVQQQNWYLRHEHPQTCGGSQSICMVLKRPTDNLQSHPRKSFRINEYWYNKYDTQKVIINKIRLEN